MKINTEPQVTQAEIDALRFHLENTNQHALLEKLFGKPKKPMSNKTKMSKNRQAGLDNIFKALAIVGGFLGIYYVYLTYFDTDIATTIAPTVRRQATLPMQPINIEGRYIKWGLVGIVVIAYRIWLKKQGILLRVLINLVFWVSAFFGTWQYLKSLNPIEIAAFLSDLAGMTGK